MAVRQRAVATLPTLMRALRKGIPKPPNPQPLASLRRAFSLYDQINLIDNVPEDQLRFQGYTDEGFTVNGVTYEGSVLCVGNLITYWSPKKFSDVTADSLSMFQIVRPIPGENPEIQVVLFDRTRDGNRKMKSDKSRIQHFTFCFSAQGCRPLDEEILILGCGRNIQLVNPELRRFIRSTGMKLEALDSRNAASTYNILNEEGRIVAAALLPFGVSS